MSKTFRAWCLDELLLLPPSVQDFVAKDHLSRFVVSLVRESLDLRAIYAAYSGEKGQPPYDPTMMVALLLKAQIIAAHGLTPGQSDQDQLAPLVDAIADDLGRAPKEVSADSGYGSEANLAALAARGIAGYLAVARAKHAADAKRKITGPLTQAMQRRLKRAGRRSRYRLQKQLSEPVFGQIKQARGFRQFLLRGREKVTAEWAMICTAHNILKLAKAA